MKQSLNYIPHRWQIEKNIILPMALKALKLDQLALNESRVLGYHNFVFTEMMRWIQQDLIIYKQELYDLKVTIMLTEKNNSLIHYRISVDQEQYLLVFSAEDLKTKTQHELYTYLKWVCLEVPANLKLR
ncbi:hypothetical protein SAMN04488134_101304 [Amphibacillus marinus]|uniref:Uncharacterized protein n=1 Tax=Amphibacillus marinus TaxID=872970 RepID=A0A1H8HBM5_9BACI|nr:hypothetical protein [Amphibacillus marinus]SEN53661.1 hypothetical protein SAMN04488134_101304 [Amphibacillus marinus]